MGHPAIINLSWFVATLTADAPLAAALGVSLAEMPRRVFADVAPEGTHEPYILITGGPNEDVRTGVGTTVVMTPGTYTAVVVKACSSYGEIQAAAERMHQLLQGSRGTTPSGAMFGVVRQTAVADTQVDRDTLRRRLGGTYRTFVQGENA